MEKEIKDELKMPDGQVMKEAIHPMIYKCNEMILKQNTLYCLRAVATAASDVNFNMQWYEHVDRN